MFCPRCGSSQAEDLKFCKACGANLSAVRKAVDTRESEDKFDCSRLWAPKPPAISRYQEIKGGIITSSTGLAITAVLFFLMEGIIRSGKVSTAAAEILGRLWIAGLIPVMVGFALIVNGYFVSKKIVEFADQNHDQPGLDGRDTSAGSRALRPADTTQFVPSNLSVTEGTTKHLDHSN